MYEAVNLQEETLETLHLAAMVFSPRTGRWSLRDLSSPTVPRPLWTGSGTREPPWPARPGVTDSPVFLHRDTLFMVSVAPILRSDGSGPPKGVLLFVREIGEQEAASLTESLLLPLKIHPAGDSLPENLREMLDSVTSAEKGFLSRPVSPEVITGFSVLRDIDGLPAALLEISSDPGAWSHPRPGIFLRVSPAVRRNSGNAAENAASYLKTEILPSRPT